MKRIFLLLALFPILLRADWDQLFSDNEDPVIFHNVSVITGNLNLSLQDVVVQGAKPISIMRTYSSSGALERSQHHEHSDSKLLRRGQLLQGGWNLLPHTHLLIEAAYDKTQFKAYLAEPNGSMIVYSYSHKQDGSSVLFLKPDRSISQSFGCLSARTNPQNNLLQINIMKGEAILFLPNGGSKIYRDDPPWSSQRLNNESFFYRLETEIFPDRHQLQYSYDKKLNLNRIVSKNPSGLKVYASIDISRFVAEKQKTSRLRFNTSDAQQLDYQTVCHEDREYLSEVQSNCRPGEYAHFTPARKGIGSRMAAFDLGGQRQFDVHYYCPANRSQERKWAEKPEQKEPQIDKVKSILEPVGSNGEMVAVASFTYYPDRTDVRDAEGLLIRYHHNSERLHSVEYFDEKDKLRSSQKFFWDGSNLRCKAMFDANNQPIFAKTFIYAGGNVVEEVLWGNLSDDRLSPLQINDQGQPTGAESYKKTYSYWETTNLIHSESEEEGPTYEYFYKLGTDLLETKLTKDHEGHILIREFRLYDEDNLLVAEIVDNGTSSSLNDLSQVTQRIEKHYQLNPRSGLPEMATELFWDPVSQTQKLLKRTKIAYVNQRVSEESVFDAVDAYRYTIYTEYDALGHIRRKTTPLGQENIYRYNSLGNLEEVKEVGAPKKIYTYDNAGRQISCRDLESETTTTSAYDAKGRVLRQTDSKGNLIQHSYDCFGNRLTTRLPAITDVQNRISEPLAEFAYDMHGNLTTAKMPQGETTQTFYNLLRKPTLIIHPDGTKIRHVYNKNGTLNRTVLSEGTEIHYRYDLFQRMTATIIYSADQKILSEESWVYDAFQLSSHTDSRGLKTSFTYDGSGRKIAESADERTTVYSYNALNFLEKTDNGVCALIQKRNSAGLVEQQWEEDSLGRIENRMQFFYDMENRKEKAVRTTSCGEAIDLFHYRNGKLDRHTDPNGAATQFIQDENFKNELGQKVLQKTVVDPIGNASIETQDAGGRLAVIEKKAPNGQTVSRETFFYDLSGNQSRRISTIYQGGRPLRDVVVAWNYDAMGRVVEEIEAGQKRTTCEYDTRGRIACKTLPDKTQLHYSYDGINRLTELQSSDGTVHLQYIYAQGPDPIQIIDLVQGVTLQRTYNGFGQIVRETNPQGFVLNWNYDSQGRCTAFTLPDASRIDYSFSGSHMSAVQRKTANGRIVYEHQYLAFDPNGHVAREQLIFNVGSVQTARDQIERPLRQSSPWLEHSVSYGLSGLVEKTQNSLFGEKICAYDALNQLTKEGNQTCLFDSMGNPSDCTTNDLNQIMRAADCELIYDANGNPEKRIRSDEIVDYFYDALNRLTEIAYGKIKKVRYSYDPLSRLLAKEIDVREGDCWQKQKKIFYLYDQDCEIGTYDEEGRLLEFKALGLGVKGDVGGAIAIEIADVIYAPLHDFRGNIIALLASDGRIAEQYDIDAFGTRQLSASSLNPWRFCSKRSEEGFVFFGLRFYDPSLKRWLTPDPSGFADGPNLYAYVRNSPLNRLDLFGLLSFGFDGFDNGPNVMVCIPVQQYANLPDKKGLLCRGEINGVTVDFYAFYNQWHKLQFTPEELESGRINLANHLHELVPSDGRSIVLTSYGNGIDTNLGEFYQANEVVAKTVAGSFMLSLYNPTEGRVLDIHRTKLERQGTDTPIVCKARQFMVWASDQLHKINPDAFWLSICHSENGVIVKRAIEGMTDGQQETLRNALHIFAVGPAEPLRKNQGASVVNVYSEKDYVTGFGPFGYAKSFMDNSDYDIRVLECKSSRSDRTLWIADHGFLKPTYQKAWVDKIDALQSKIGFYGRSANAQTR